MVTTSNAPSFAATSSNRPSMNLTATPARSAAARAASTIARLRIDADDLAAIGRKADRQNARPGADIEQALASIEAELLCDGGEERRAIGRPGALVIGDGGGEASHGDPCGVELEARPASHRTAA